MVFRARVTKWFSKDFEELVKERRVTSERPDSAARRAAFRESGPPTRALTMSKFFINRPIVAIVIAILMTIIGGVSMIALPIAQYPNIVPPEIQVRRNYPGADAQTIEQSVATPIEQQMSGVDKSNYMQSVNANNGDIRLTVNFDVATDPNIDQILTQMRVAQAQSQLPAGRGQLRRDGAEIDVRRR